jgi:transposase
MLALLTPAHQTRPAGFAAPPWDRQHPDWLRLDQQLPLHDDARLVDQLVDQLDLRPLYQRYAGHGSAALPPDRLLKVALYHFSQNQPSPKHWAQQCRRDGPTQWLACGLRPSVAACYRFRHKVGPGLLDHFNRQVLQLARDQGHLLGQRGAADGTLIAAWGSRHSLLGAKALQTRLQLLRQLCASDRAAPRLPRPWLVLAFLIVLLVVGPEPLHRLPRWLAKTAQGRQRQRRRYRAAWRHLHRVRAEHQRKQKRQRKAKRRSAETLKVCPREHQAVLGRDKLKVFRPLYNVQFVCDLDSPFVLGYGTYAAVSDAGLLPQLLGRTRYLAGRLPKQLAMDGIYATALDLKDCQARGVEAYAPERAPASAPASLPLAAATDAGVTAAVAAAPASGALPPAEARAAGATAAAAAAKRSSSAKRLGKGAFTWLASEQAYRCPAGKLLPLYRRGKEKRRQGQEVEVAQYRCPAAHCLACPLASACTKSPHKGRTIKRLAEEELVEQLRVRMATAAGQALYRLRKQTVELGFADSKCRRGLERMRGFGRRLAQSQTGWSVLAHNGLALMRAGQSRAAKGPPGYLWAG